MRPITWSLPAALLALVAAAPVPGQTAPVSQPGTIEVNELPARLGGEWLFRIGHDPSWASPFRESRSWQQIEVPGAWERNGFPGYNGHAWYRLRLFISSRFAGERLGLNLGMIGDSDEVFLNGRLVGSTGGFPPRFDKATLVHRYYAIPLDAIRFGEYNELSIHVYNASRFGGLLGPTPRIDRYQTVLSHQVVRDILIYVVAAFLVALALAQLALFLFERGRPGHLSLGGFFLCVVLYLLTYTSWGPRLLIGDNATFRLNAASLLGSVALFASVLLALAGRRRFTALALLQSVLALAIAFTLLWPEIADLYVAVYVGEAGILAIALLSIAVIAKLFRERSPWAPWLAITLGVETALIGLDVLMDLTLIDRYPVFVGDLFFPLALIPLAAVVSAASTSEWARAHWGEPADLEADVLPRERFLVRLDSAIEQARADRRQLSLAMLRVTVDGTRPEDPAGSNEAVPALRRALRHLDLLGRYDATILLVAFADTDERLAVATLERLRRLIKEQVGRQQGMHVTAGLGEFRPVRHQRARDLLQDTEAALYAALAEGGDCTATAP